MRTDRWKGQEREVAKFFGVTRNVHGRGDSGSLKSDVVITLYSEDGSGWCNRTSIDIPFFTHFFIEVKYSKGIDGKVFSIMNDAARNSGANKCKTIPIVRWGQYMLFYLKDFNKVLDDLIIQPRPREHIKHALNKFTVTHQHTQVPGYIEDYCSQAEDDVIIHRDQKGWHGLPFACMTSSKKNRIVIYNTSFERK